ncbi:MAG: thioredoxin domain-containing protein [Planctomycetota bacterium]
MRSQAALLRSALAMLLLAAGSVAGQGKPSATPPTAGKPPADGEDCEAESYEGIVAIIGDELIPEEQIEGMVAGRVAELRERWIETRFGTIQEAIQELLVEQEARRRGIDSQALLEKEVYGQVEEPTEAAVILHFQRNQERFGDTLESVREEVSQDLRRTRMAEIARRYLEGLVDRTKIEILLNFRREQLDLPLDQVIARVGGEVVLWSQVAEQIEDVDHEMAWQEYQERRTALELLINDRLLSAEARSRGLSRRALLEKDAWSKARDVSEKDARAFYDGNRERVVGAFDDIEEQILEYLRQQERHRVELELAQALRVAADVRVLLKEPEPPVHIIDTDGCPSKGRDDAPVTVVKLTDFQCARCAEVYRHLHEILARYPETVRLVMRNYPLQTAHEHAHEAALAAEAARIQGSYWEYVEALFRKQESLSPRMLEEQAERLGLDMERFRRDRKGDGCMSRVLEDLAEGQRLGVSRTPSVYVNGRRVDDKSREGLWRAVERERKRLGL